MIKSEFEQLSEQLDSGLIAIQSAIVAVNKTIALFSADMAALKTLVQQGNTDMANFKSAISDAMATLTAQVTANTNAENSAVQLVTELAAMIQANAADPQAVLALASQLQTSAAALGAAVTANTPAPAPAPAPAV